MEVNYDPLWDERGELRRGCTVREALDWLTRHGSHSAGESVYINGASSMHQIGQKLRTSPSLASMTAITDS